MPTNLPQRAPPFAPSTVSSFHRSSVPTSKLTVRPRTITWWPSSGASRPTVSLENRQTRPLWDGSFLNSTRSRFWCRNPWERKWRHRAPTARPFLFLIHPQGAGPASVKPAASRCSFRRLRDHLSITRPSIRTSSFRSALLSASSPLDSLTSHGDPPMATRPVAPDKDWLDRLELVHRRLGSRRNPATWPEFSPLSS